mgnify:CR=1 FL=1
MILTTTDAVEDYKILAYRGIVSGIAVNAQKVTMTFNMEKYYEGISESVAEIKEKAFEKLTENAEKLNANAVVGITVDVELTSSGYIFCKYNGNCCKHCEKVIYSIYLNDKKNAVSILKRHFFVEYKASLLHLISAKYLQEDTNW